MMMLLLGRLPREGDVAEWGGWRLEIVDMDGRRVDKVIAFPAGGRSRPGAARPGVPAGTSEVVPSTPPEASQKEVEKG